MGWKTLMDKAHQKPKQDSWWAGLAAVALLAVSVSGVLRAYGAVANRQALLDSGLTNTQLRYLVVYGGFQAVTSLVGFLGMYRRPPQLFALPWAAVILNIAGYWAERLLLWSPDQRGGNIVFMLIWHGLWLALMAAFTIKPTTKETDGTGN
jgi:hypothetical protein